MIHDVMENPKWLPPELEEFSDAMALAANRFTNWTNFEPSESHHQQRFRRIKPIAVQQRHRHPELCSSFCLYCSNSNITQSPIQGSDARCFSHVRHVVVADTSGCVIVRGNWVLEKCQTPLPGLEHMTNTHVLELWVILKLSVLMCLGCKPRSWH